MDKIVNQSAQNGNGARYIDVDALLEQLKSNEPFNWTDSEREIQEQLDYRSFIALIEKQPVTDVVELALLDEKEIKIEKNRREAVQQFAERLKMRLIQGGIYPAYVKNQINMLLEEMIGGERK